MKVFALSDLHLASATPRKEMAVFGDHWLNHARKIACAWEKRVGENDLVIVAGDISWAMKLEDALPDIEFIAGLPGRKILLRGNHDYWWRSLSRIRACLPERVFVIQNDALILDGVALGGSRLWIDHELSPFTLPSRERAEGMQTGMTAAGLDRRAGDDEAARAQDEKLFQRELGRLELSVSQMEEGADLKIAVVHFPPLSTDLKDSRASRILEAAGVDHCVFGHLHNLVPSPGRGFFFFLW